MNTRFLIYVDALKVFGFYRNGTKKIKTNIVVVMCKMRTMFHPDGGEKRKKIELF